MAPKDKSAGNESTDDFDALEEMISAASESADEPQSDWPGLQLLTHLAVVFRVAGPLSPALAVPLLALRTGSLDRPVVRNLFVALLAAAATLYIARHITHVALGWVTDSDARRWAAAEFVLSASWVVATTRAVTRQSSVPVVLLVSVVALASLVIARLTESVIATINTVRRAEGKRQIITGRRYLSNRNTSILTSQQIMDDLFVRRLSRWSPRWRTSGLVIAALALAVTYVSGSATELAAESGHDQVHVAAPPTTAHTFHQPPRQRRTRAQPRPTDLTIAPGYYSVVCKGQGQPPGADAPRWARSHFRSLLVPLGGIVAGCAQPTERTEGGCFWELGRLDGRVRSVAVVTPSGDDAVFLDDSAPPALAYLSRGLCVGGSQRVKTYHGDVQLLYTPDGT